MKTVREAKFTMPQTFAADLTGMHQIAAYQNRKRTIRNE
jgi:hypothetical protein